MNFAQEQFKISKLRSIQARTLKQLSTKECPNIPGRLPENEPPLISISTIGIERIEDIEKRRFLYKNIFEVGFILMAFRS